MLYTCCYSSEGFFQNGWVKIDDLDIQVKTPETPKETKSEEVPEKKASPKKKKKKSKAVQEVTDSIDNGAGAVAIEPSDVVAQSNVPDTAAVIADAMQVRGQSCTEGEGGTLKSLINALVAKTWGH